MQAWVVGGTSGIGAAIVEELKNREIQPLVLSNDSRTGADIKARGVAFEYLDLARTGREVMHKTTDLLQRYGHPTYVFMSAGLTQETSALDTTPEDWLLLANVNLLGVALLCNTIAHAWCSVAFEPWKRHFVMLGSVNALRPLSSQGAYSVMKAGLHAYAKCLSNDVTDSAIRVNTVVPGAIWTPMNQSLLSQEDDTARRRVEEASLLGRWGHAQEIAEVAIWLALDSPAFLTGAEVVVDGGHVVKR